VCVSTGSIARTNFPRSPDPEEVSGSGSVVCNPRSIFRIFKKLINPEKVFGKFLELLPDPEASFVILEVFSEFSKNS
jgi:hypothetical protein